MLDGALTLNIFDLRSMYNLGIFMYKTVVIVAVVACTVNLETYFNQNMDEEVFCFG